MKIVYKEGIDIVIIINNNYMKIDNIHDKDEMEKAFKDIFLRLRNNYNLKINGYLNIDAYFDEQYGIVLEVDVLDNDFFRMLDNKIDMKISFHSDNEFLYEIEDYYLLKELDINECEVYLYKDKYYIKLNKNLEYDYVNTLLEYSNLIYGIETMNIVRDYNKI